MDSLAVLNFRHPMLAYIELNCFRSMVRLATYVSRPPCLMQNVDNRDRLLKHPNDAHLLLTGNVGIIILLDR